MLKALWWTSTVLYMAIIYYFSSMSSLKSPVSFPHADKVAHAIEYGILSILLYFALRSTSRFSPRLVFFIAFSITLLFGFSDEVHQFFVAGRNCSGGDLVADGLGGYLFLVVIRYFHEKSEKPT